MSAFYRFHDGETTQTVGPKNGVSSTEGEGALYVSGLSSETVDLEARPPDSSDTWQPVLSGKGNGWHGVSQLPDGDYRVTKSGSAESATTELQVF